MPAPKAELTPLETYLTSQLRALPDGKCRSCGTNPARTDRRQTVCGRCQEFRSYTKRTEGEARWPELDELGDWLDAEQARDSNQQVRPSGVKREVLVDPAKLVEIEGSGGRHKRRTSEITDSGEHVHRDTFHSPAPAYGWNRDYYYQQVGA